jgi:hypothetical protein
VISAVFIAIIFLTSYVVSHPVTLDDKIESTEGKEIVMKIEKLNEQLPGNLDVAANEKLHFITISLTTL